MATAPVGRRWVPARRLFFTEVAATLWTTAAADGAAGGFGASACTSAATSVTTGVRLDRFMPSIHGGGGAGEKGEREIGGNGSGGARTREGNKLKCPSRQRAEGDIGWASILRAELEIPGLGREFYRRP
jgi:hypothetical protein